MRFLGLVLAPIATTAAALLLFACGGGDDQLLRSLTTDDLKQMVIQMQDLGPGYTLSESHEGGEMTLTEGAVTGYEVRYRLEPGTQGEQGVEAVVSEIQLFPTVQAAKAGLAELEEMPWGDPEFSALAREMSAPDLGDQTFAMSMHIPEGTCYIGCTERPGEAFVIFVRRENAVWSVMAIGEGASSDDVISAGTDLATKQQERVEAVLKGGP